MQALFGVCKQEGTCVCGLCSKLTTGSYHPIDLSISQRALDRVTERPGETWREICDYIEGKPNSTRSTLTKLVDSGKIYRHESKYYPIEHVRPAPPPETAAEAPVFSPVPWALATVALAILAFWLGTHA